MAKELVTLHIYASTSEWSPGEITVSSIDCRPVPGCMKGMVYLGSQSVALSWADIDIKQAQLDSLNAEIADERAASQMRVNLLLDRISKLKAIGHEVAQ